MWKEAGAQRGIRKQREPREIEQKVRPHTRMRKTNNPSFSETIETPLLLPPLTHRHHPFLQPRHPGLRLLPLVPFLLHRLQTQSGAIPLLPQRPKLILVRPGFLFPHIHIVLDFFALVFQVDEGFLEGGGELFLREEVLLNGADAGLLFFGVLGVDLGLNFGGVGGRRGGSRESGGRGD